MEKRMLLLGLVFIVVGLCSSGALASPMGPPVAGLEVGQFSVGVEYSSTDMDVSIDGTLTASATGLGEVSEDYSDTTNVESNMIFGNIGYGIYDYLEVFVRLGMADASFENVDSNYKFAYGFGTKAMSLI